MKRRFYYPSAQAQQANWLGNFADKLGDYQSVLELTDDQVEEGVADALYLKYAISQWLSDVRTFQESATQAIDVLSYGSSAGVYTLPLFTPPPLPPGDP